MSQNTDPRAFLLSLRDMGNDSHMQPSPSQQIPYELRSPPKRLPGDAEWALKQAISGPSHRNDSTPYEGERTSLEICTILLRAAQPEMGAVKRIEYEGSHYSTWHAERGRVQVGVHWCNIERGGIKLSLAESVLIPWEKLAA